MGSGLQQSQYISQLSFPIIKTNTPSNKKNTPVLVIVSLLGEKKITFCYKKPETELPHNHNNSQTRGIVTEQLNIQ